MDGPTTVPNDRKVTVECADPSDLFDTVQPLLTQRLPLKDLNWKSPSRPLRSITSLSLELVKAKSKSVTSSQEDGLSQRRHQIPGLRKTPYLKVYLLRCDDKETYKNTSRKLVREWIKNVTQSSGSSTSGISEGHDACEWLILHVVLPDTPAANEPRSSKRSSDGPSDSTDSVSGKSKWTGKGTSTVLEKIKADFNGSSKSALDRVAQIRLSKGGDPQAAALSTGLSKMELEATWQDVLEKFKSGILTSFDMRVKQYEEDIREKDSQRALPGWNFCTFFILKEGLSIGFEEVGLFEDALVGYDELAYSLDVVIRGQAAGEGDEHGGVLSTSTDDLQRRLDALLAESDDGPNESNGKERQRPLSTSFQLSTSEFPLDTNSKSYRELILANQISIFDFRVYIFARQLALLLKAARQPNPHSRNSMDEDFLLLAEICHRTTEFLGTGSRSLQEDLQHGCIRNEPTQHSDRVRAIIRNVVHSWSYRVTLQILTQTSTKGLDVPSSGIIDSKNVSEPSGQLADEHSSNPGLQQDQLRAPSSDFDSTQGMHRRLSQGQLHDQGQKRPPGSKAGTEALATARGELYLTARKVIQKIGSSRSWRTDWDDLDTIVSHQSLDTNDMRDVDLEGTEQTKRIGTPLDDHFTVIGLEPLQLLRAASTEEGFQLLFNSLSDQAYRHFLAGNRFKSAESLVADIALQKYRSKDYLDAGKLFRRLSAFYDAKTWPVLSGTLLELYAKCLKQLSEGSEYVSVIVKLLSFWAQKPRLEKGLASNSQALLHYYDDLLRCSERLPELCQVPFQQLFCITSLPSRIFHAQGRDGFYLHLDVQCLLPFSVHIANGLTLRMKCVSDLYAPPLMIYSRGSCTIQPTSTVLTFESTVTAFGSYALEELSFRIGHLDFHHNFKQAQRVQPTELETPINVAEEEQPQVVLFPASRALTASITPRRQLKLGDRAQMEVQFRSGWNDVSECTWRIKPATAGLRLRISEIAILEDGDVAHDMQVIEVEGFQSIQFKSFPPESCVRFAVPYTIENPEIVQLEARLEVFYQTVPETFTLFKIASMNAMLPISINVQDLFRSADLLSRFTVGCATLVPLRLMDCQIQGNSQVKTSCGIGSPMHLEISPKQPASLLYRFTPRWKSNATSEGRTLLLQAQYLCLDEVALDTLEQHFQADLLASPISSLTGLLLPHLLNIFRSHWTASDLETISLLREIVPWSYEDFQWDSVLAGLDKDTRLQATSWLKLWHSTNGSIALREVGMDSELRRLITISVELPSPRAVITASLRVGGRGSPSLPVAFGQALTAELCLSYSALWAPPEGAPQNESFEIVYELTTSPETWLIGGRKRGNFVARPGQKQTFSIILLPQRPGHLPLPSVDVKCYKLDEDVAEVASWKRNEVEYELDFRSHAKCILVIPDLRETTLALDGEGAGRGEWLVGSRRQVELS